MFISSGPDITIFSYIHTSSGLRSFYFCHKLFSLASIHYIYHFDHLSLPNREKQRHKVTQTMDFTGICHDNLFMYNVGMPQGLQTAPMGSTSSDTGTEDLFFQHSPSQQDHGGFKRDEIDDDFYSPSPASKKRRIEIDRTHSSNNADNYGFPSSTHIPPAKTGISSFGEMDVLSGKESLASLKPSLAFRWL